MDYTLIIIILFSVWGCGITCWFMGQRAGIENAVQHMIDQGMIDVEE